MRIMRKLSIGRTANDMARNYALASGHTLRWQVSLSAEVNKNINYLGYSQDQGYS